MQNKIKSKEFGRQQVPVTKILLQIQFGVIEKRCEENYESIWTNIIPKNIPSIWTNSFQKCFARAK